MIKNDLELIQEQIEPVLDSENRKTLDEIQFIRREGGTYAKKGNFSTLSLKVGTEKVRNLLKSLYPRFTLTEIEKITGIPDSTLERWFNVLDIPFNAFHCSIVSIPSNKNKEYFQEDITGKVSKIVEIKITPELVYLIGFTLGDGSVQKYMVEVFNKDRKLREHLFGFLKQYGTITEEERENGLWRLRLSSARIANLIKNDYGIRKDTIDYIFNNEELAKQFIAAFWDAEGTVRKQHNYYHIYLYNCDKYLINKICDFLKIKNIKFSIHERATRHKEYSIGKYKVISKKRLIRINIHKPSWPDWLSEIGMHMHHSKKRKVVNEILNLFGGNQNDKDLRN